MPRMPAITLCPAFARVMAVNLPNPVLVPVMKIVFDMIFKFLILLFVEQYKVASPGNPAH
jgi:hypothetical protein